MNTQTSSNGQNLYHPNNGQRPPLSYWTLWHKRQRHHEQPSCWHLPEEIVLPTGQQPVDSLNIIWRKNETYLDIGCYSVGSAVMVIWPMMIMFISLAYGLNDIDLLWLGGIITGIPTLMLIHGLFRPTPPPVRFNRQRREVCVPRDNGEYWIVP
ncbi:hypothetical protein A258_07942, partial [Pseudomonas syringae pv. actinidiae ICMP 19104]